MKKNVLFCLLVQVGVIMIRLKDRSFYDWVRLVHENQPIGRYTEKQTIMITGAVTVCKPDWLVKISQLMVEEAAESALQASLRSRMFDRVELVGFVMAT